MNIPVRVSERASKDPFLKNQIFTPILEALAPLDNKNYAARIKVSRILSGWRLRVEVMTVQSSTPTPPSSTSGLNMPELD